MNYYDWVFVVDEKGNPRKPISQKEYRRIKKKCETEIISYEPFTIKVFDYYENEKQNKIVLKIDSGYLNIGFSVQDDENEYLAGEVKMLTGMSDRITTRRENRRLRRSRLRYRKNKNVIKKIINNPTYKNGNEEGWFAPSIKHKIFTHLKLVEQIQKFIHIDEIVVEVANFDIQKLKNPDIEGKDYQNGPSKGYSNIHAYILDRDKHTCKLCKKQSNKLEVHHILPRSEGGTDIPENMITLCSACHKKIHKNGWQKFHNEYKDKLPKGFKDSTFMNIVRWEIVTQMRNQFHDIEVHVSFGNITKCNRQYIDEPLLKTHYNDAFCIRERPNINMTKNIWIIQQKRRNNRCMESFFDAKYIDSRDGKIKKGYELCKIREKRSTENVDNQRIYRQQKVEKGRRQMINNHRQLKPGDYIRIGENDKKNSNKIMEVVTSQSVKNGYKVVYKNIYDYSKKPKTFSKNISDEKKVLFKNDTLFLVRRRRGFLWYQWNRKDYEEYIRNEKTA